MESALKRTWAEIDLDALEHNYRTLRAHVGPQVKFLGVVKADSYGHGCIEVSHLLQELGADYLAVSSVDEAAELRGHGITMPILILGYTPAYEVETLIELHVTQAVTSPESARAYSAAAVRCGAALKVHIKADTGMSRLGVLCRDERFDGGVENIIKACRMPGLIPEGAFTHFAVSDEPGADNEAYTREQFRLFCEVLDEVEAKGGVKFEIRHCANSGAVAKYPEMALDMVRPGLLLYGYGDEAGRLNLKPCMRFMTRVTTIKHYPAGTDVSYGRRFTTARTTRMGVVGVGYADGLPRLCSNKCAFAAGSGFAPQRGSICMDMCMIDLTDLPEVSVGDEVEIFGAKTGVETLAAAAGTISYELLCALSKRVPRVYKNF